jgi:hypothetical protein
VSLWLVVSEYRRDILNGRFNQKLQVAGSTIQVPNSKERGDLAATGYGSWTLKLGSWSLELSGIPDP